VPQGQKDHPRPREEEAQEQVPGQGLAEVKAVGEGGGEGVDRGHGAGIEGGGQAHPAEEDQVEEGHPEEGQKKGFPQEEKPGQAAEKEEKKGQGKGKAQKGTPLGRNLPRGGPRGHHVQSPEEGWEVDQGVPPGLPHTPSLPRAGPKSALFPSGCGLGGGLAGRGLTEWGWAG